MAKNVILKNQESFGIYIQDLGDVVVPASGQLDIGAMFEFKELTSSEDLEAEISNETLIVNDGIRDLTLQESLYYLDYRTKLSPYNPDEWTYMLQANVCYNIFLNHTEEVYLESELKNAVVDTFKGYGKLSSYSQVEVDGSALVLEGSASVQIDSMDDAEDGVTWDDEGDCLLTLETTIKHEGTGSAKLDLTKSDTTSWKGIKKRDYSNQDWETPGYDEILLWIYGEGLGEEVRCLIKGGGDNQYSQTFVLSAGWQRVILDISTITGLHDVDEFRIQCKKGVIADQVIYVDDFCLRNSDTYQTSGYAISNATTTVADITQIYFTNLIDVPESTSYVCKISLDGGTTWHSLIEAEFDCWVDVSTWTEYDTFTNLKNIKTRIELATTDNTVSPVYDDYLLMWKLDA